MIAPTNDDARAIAGAKALEDILNLGTVKPIDPRSGK